MTSETWHRLQIMTWMWNPTKQMLQTFRLVFCSSRCEVSNGILYFALFNKQLDRNAFLPQNLHLVFTCTLLHCWKSAGLQSVVKSQHKNPKSITQSISQVVKSLFKSICICEAPVYNKGYLMTLSNLIWSRQSRCWSSSFWVLFDVFGLNEQKQNLWRGAWKPCQ